MLEGPIPATRRILERNRMSVSDIDVFEMDEAFAPIVLAWERELTPAATGSTSTAVPSHWVILSAPVVPG